MRTHWLVMDPGTGSARTVSHPGGRCRAASSGHALTTDELMSTTRHHTHIDLERLTGIHERRVSVGDEDSYSLATSAALDCLDRAGRRPHRSTS